RLRRVDGGAAAKADHTVIGGFLHFEDTSLDDRVGRLRDRVAEHPGGDAGGFERAEHVANHAGLHHERIRHDQRTGQAKLRQHLGDLFHRAAGDQQHPGGGDIGGDCAHGNSSVVCRRTTAPSVRRGGASGSRRDSSKCRRMRLGVAGMTAGADAARIPLPLVQSRRKRSGHDTCRFPRRSTHGYILIGTRRSPERSTVMDFALTDAQAQIRDQIVRICARFDDTYWLERDRSATFPDAFFQAMAEGNWLGIAMPEAYGGAGLGITEAAVMMQAVAESGAAMSGASAIHINIFGLNPVVVYGSEAQKQRMLPPLIAGRDKAAFGVTEPNTGLNTTQLMVRADRDGDAYRINGTKI